MPSKEVLKSLQEGREKELSSSIINMVDSAHGCAMSDKTQLMLCTKGTVFGAYNALMCFKMQIPINKDQEAKLKSMPNNAVKPLSIDLSFE